MICNEAIILQGRNDLAVHVITREHGYLTWEDAYLCLTSDLLPDCIRAKYCELIIGKFTLVLLKTVINGNKNVTHVMIVMTRLSRIFITVSLDAKQL